MRDESLKRERDVIFLQNQKLESIKAEELNKRIEQKEWVHTKEQPKWNKERQVRRDFQEANSKASTNEKGESSSNIWVLSNAHLGKISKMGFWAFYISFISNTWTWPTLQLMNKDLLEVLVVFKHNSCDNFS